MVKRCLLPCQARLGIEGLSGGVGLRQAGTIQTSTSAGPLGDALTTRNETLPSAGSVLLSVGFKNTTLSRLLPVANPVATSGTASQVNLTFCCRRPRAGVVFKPFDGVITRRYAHIG